MDQFGNTLAALTPQVLNAASSAVFLVAVFQAIAGTALLLMGVALVVAASRSDSQGDGPPFAAVVGIVCFLSGVILWCLTSTWMALVNPEAALVARFLP